MTKDNLISALGGSVIGIILGVLLASYSSAPRQTASIQPPAMQDTMGSGQNGGRGQMDQTQLPEGHPPINEESIKMEIATYEETLKKDPENQEAIVSLATLQFNLKNYMTASKYYEQAVKKDPKNVDLITQLGSCYLWLNETDKAVQLYNQSLAINPKHLETLMNLGIARMTMGDREGAAQAWEKVIELYPDNPETPMLKDAVKRLREKKAGNS